MSRSALPERMVSRKQVRLAFTRVDRREFLPPWCQDQAAANTPLPIGYGQTTSQPSLIEWMIIQLGLRAGERILEIGTGSGYQTAILAELGCVEVYSIEIVPELAQQAAERLQRLGYGRVHLKQGDGYEGWAEHAPYDGILVSAACSTVPPPLQVQVAEHGRLIIPLGRPEACQVLWRFVRIGGRLVGRATKPVAFVPLTGRALASNH